MRALAAALLLLASAGLAPAQPTAPPATRTAQASEIVDRSTLERLYQAELGKAYAAELFPKLFEAHQRVEQYFAAPTAAERKALTADLEQTGLDPNLVGRIVRIRLHWPKLDGGIYYINERVGPHPVQYFVGLPHNYDRGKAWPLVIKLPGAHPFVTPPIPDAEGVAALYKEWVADELKAHPDAIVLMPLLNLDELWGPSYKGMNSVMQPLFHAAGRFNIDPRGVYMVGHGMSAHAVWNLSVHYPTYFAAINPMSGGATVPFQQIRFPNLRNIYSVVWHDAEDKLSPVKLSRDVVKSLRALKYDVEYEESKGLGHAPSDQIASDLYDRMRARTRDLYPKDVVLASNRPDTIFNRNDWVQVFQMLKGGADQRLRMQLGSGFITVHQNSYRITAQVKPENVIDVKTENVESMRFYLNDQMMDLSRPVKVLVNGRPRFEGMARPSMEVMLTDQLLLGRGWRYFTAVAEVDFGTPPQAPIRPTTKPGGSVGD